VGFRHASAPIKSRLREHRANATRAFGPSNSMWICRASRRRRT
jgi:hypothetical protein